MPPHMFTSQKSADQLLQMPSTDCMPGSSQLVCQKLSPQLGRLVNTILGVQSCDGVMWKRLTEQFASLGVEPEGLPEEALTQIYQVSIQKTSPKETKGWFGPAFLAVGAS